jgi:hypothetical protein
MGQATLEQARNVIRDVAGAWADCAAQAINEAITQQLIDDLGPPEQFVALLMSILSVGSVAGTLLEMPLIEAAAEAASTLVDLATTSPPPPPHSRIGS